MDNKEAKKPLVFIVILNFNDVHDTIECVNSCLKNSYNNFKILVVDNCSEDNSFSILRNTYSHHDKVIICQTNRNLGFTGGNNFGIEIAVKGGADYVFILNNDTVVDKNFLVPIIDVMEKDKKIGAASGMIKDHKNNLIQYAGVKTNLYLGRSINFGDKEKDTGQYNYLSEVDALGGPAFCVRVSAILRTGVFKDHWFMFGDEEFLSYKLKSNGFKICYVPFSYVYHKGSATTKQYSLAVSFFGLRNRIWIERLFANHFQFLFFLFYLFLYIFPRIILGHLYHRRFTAIKYSFSALREGLCGNPENQVEYKDFSFLIKKEKK